MFDVCMSLSVARCRIRVLVSLKSCNIPRSMNPSHDFSSRILDRKEASSAWSGASAVRCRYFSTMISRSINLVFSTRQFWLVPSLHHCSDRVHHCRTSPVVDRVDFSNELAVAVETTMFTAAEDLSCSSCNQSLMNVLSSFSTMLYDQVSWPNWIPAEFTTVVNSASSISLFQRATCSKKRGEWSHMSATLVSHQLDNLKACACRESSPGHEYGGLV